MNGQVSWGGKLPDNAPPPPPDPSTVEDAGPDRKPLQQEKFTGQRKVW